LKLVSEEWDKNNYRQQGVKSIKTHFTLNVTSNQKSKMEKLIKTKKYRKLE